MLVASPARALMNNPIIVATQALDERNLTVPLQSPTFLRFRTKIPHQNLGRASSLKRPQELSSQTLCIFV